MKRNGTKRQATAPEDAVAVTMADAGRMLALSPRTIQNMIRDGRIRAVRLGRAVRVPIDEVRRVGGAVEQVEA